MLKTRMMHLSNFRVQGKSAKQIKEAFIQLRASFAYVTKQLEECRELRDSLQKEVRELTKVSEKKEEQNSRLEEKSKEVLNRTKESLREKQTNLSSEITKLNRKVRNLEQALERSRARSNYHMKVKYGKSVIIKDLRSELKDLRDKLKKTSKELDREKLKQKPKIRYISRVRTVTNTNIVKEPLPDKLRQLMLDTSLTRGKMDYIAIIAALLRFSDKTRLTIRQCLMLLELSNFQYAKHEYIINKSSFTLSELESKGLIAGDRAYTKKAVGWYLTDKGRRVVNMLLKRLSENHKIKKEFIKNEDR